MHTAGRYRAARQTSQETHTTGHNTLTHKRTMTPTLCVCVPCVNAQHALRAARTGKMSARKLAHGQLIDDLSQDISTNA